MQRWQSGGSKEGHSGVSGWSRQSNPVQHGSAETLGRNKIIFVLQIIKSKVEKGE